MSAESVLPDAAVGPGSKPGTDGQVDQERMLRYKALAMAFSYPDESFHSFFADGVEDAAGMPSEYDRLFRACDIWLYGAEYMAENEFQRANLLSNIMGFYKAFGLEPDKERPDALNCEMEFMHYLIVKRTRAEQGLVAGDAREKAAICADAEKKFFTEHLAPAATQIARKVLSASEHPFYKQAAADLLAFLECEQKHFEEEEQK